jgi:5-methylcytosine-specific restriction endonuclease McrA
MAKGIAKIFYASAEWLRKRAEILKRDNHECQICKSRGRFSPATCVHHIKHLLMRWDLRLTDDNLLSLCDQCHNEVHPEKFRENFPKKRLISQERW